MSSFLGGGGGGGGGGMAIGGAVSGGTSKSVLFIDGSGNLAQANVDFNYDNSTKILNIGDTTTTAGTLQLGVPNGPGTFGIRGPQTLGIGSGSYTLEFPTTRGTNGEVFTSNGDGTTTWTTLAPGNAGVILAADGSGGFESDPAISINPTTHALFFGDGVTLTARFADQGYFIDTPTSGSTLDLTGYNPVFTEIVDPAGTLAFLTIKLPNASINGQILRLKFTQAITALTITGNTGDSVKGAPTTIALGGYIDCQFTGTAGSGTWYC